MLGENTVGRPLAVAAGGPASPRRPEREQGRSRQAGRDVEHRSPGLSPAARRAGRFALVAALTVGGSVGCADGSGSRRAAEPKTARAATASTTTESRSTGVDPAPKRAFEPPTLEPVPAAIARACVEMAARTPGRILCPRRLPRPFLGNLPGHEPLPLRLSILSGRYGGGRLVPVGASFGYGAGWEPASGRDWKLHAWRNRPCCFLHFDVYEAPPRPDWLRADRARPLRLAGRSGFFAWSSYHAPIGFSNHVRFAWREHGRWYVATLHFFGPGTKPLLEALVRELRPVHA